MQSTYGHGLVRIVSALVFALLVPAAFVDAADYGGYRPHYQGYGVNTPGGRGGSVQRVTHLVDTMDQRSPYWNGSFRKAVTTPGARFVVFEVSGTIPLVTDISIASPYITIAGQTAPSPGILIRGGHIQIDTHDVVIQHLRIRPGNIAGQPHGIWVRSNATNIVIDHVSISWAVWTSLTVSVGALGPGIGDVTVIDSIVSEALACSGVNVTIPCSPAGGVPNSRAMVVGDGFHDSTYNNGIQRVAFIRTLSAQNNDRHPAIQGASHTFLVNNLIYNPSLAPWSGILYSDGYRKGALLSVAKNNVLIPGPTTPGHNGYKPRYWPEVGDVKLVTIDSTIAPGTQIYLDGNYYARHCGGTACLASPSAQWMLVRDNANGRGRAMVPPLSLPNLPLSSALPYSQVESYVLANVGARPLDRDPVDARVIQAVRSRTGRAINNTSEVGGFPVLAQNRRVLSVPAGPGTVVDGFGRTRIEAWLESFARALEPGGKAPAESISAPSNLRITP